MYSIPYPSSSDIPPIKVPYVAVCRYSLSAPYRFDNFLSDRENLLLSLFLASGSAWERLRSKQQLAASLWQSWLFFGLASEALGRDVDHREFLETASDDGYSEGTIDIRISRWFWIELCKRWEDLRTAHPKNVPAKERDRLIDCVAHTYVLLYLRDKDEKVDETLAKVFLSVRMLHCVIADVAGFSLDHPSAAADPSRSSTQLLLRRMTAYGWCKKRLNFVNAATIAYPSLYYLSSITPSHAAHTNHVQCTAETCSVSTSLQLPRHQTTGCACQDVCAPMDRVIQILKEDGIPLVRVRQIRNELQLEVVRYTKGAIYTAISHVWSDQQFGSSKNGLPQCQVEHLDSILAELPIPFEYRWIFGLLPRDLIGSWRSKPKVMREGHKVEWLFWLDTFCIPQEPTQHLLRRKAIDMMNLVYGAASQTLILDAGLQTFDAGQDPSSDCLAGPPLFFGPSKGDLADGLAHICGTSWMGRAWTLQEAVVSRSTIFRFRKSFAILNILDVLTNQLLVDIAPEPPFFQILLHMLFGVTYSRTRIVQETLENDPLAGSVAADLLRVVRKSLDAGVSMFDYPLKPDERARKFMSAHCHLQSRSTTLPEDLPLILVNLSGLNSNYVSQICDTDERMRLLIYALGGVPVELLYSDCHRLGDDAMQVDGWIPREVVPETFAGEHLLQLGPSGFTFQRTEDATPYEFVLFLLGCPRTARYSLFYCEKKSNEPTRFQVEVLSKSTNKSPVSSKARICVLLDQSLGKDRRRGAQFVITRVNHGKVFLRYMHSIRLWKADGHSLTSMVRAEPGDIVFGMSPPPLLEFLLERSSTPQTNDLVRPQNPEQYTARLELLISQIVPLLRYPLDCYSTRFWHRTLSNSKMAVAVLLLQGSLQHWLEVRFLQGLTHYAWAATYRRSWTPQGRWKWFWRCMNFQSPISLRTYAKFNRSMSFIACVLQHRYAGMFSTSMYMILSQERRQLGYLYLWTFVYYIMQRVIPPRDRNTLR